jgi:hypothetical protein
MSKKLGTIGNLVHDSVPLSDNEVRSAAALPDFADSNRTTTNSFAPGRQKATKLRSVIASPTTMFSPVWTAMNPSVESRLSVTAATS